MTFDPAPYIAWHRQENARLKQAIEERMVRARLEADRLTDQLFSLQPGLKAVYLFGSAALGVTVNPNFDIDLALEGGDVYQALDLVSDSEFDIDLVQLNNLPEHFQKRVKENGIRFERQPTRTPFLSPGAT